MAPRFDVVAENFKSGTMDRLGLGYDDVAAVHPAVVYVSVSGFGNRGDSPYGDWPAYSSIVEAMSGIYEYTPTGRGAAGQPRGRPRRHQLGAVRRHRRPRRPAPPRPHRRGQHVDVAMFDATVAMTDIVTNFASMGMPRHPFPAPFILDTFRAADGWFVMQLVREHQFERLAEVVGCPEWRDDPRLETRLGWGEHLEDVVRPGVEAWAASRTKFDAARELTAAGVAAGPCLESAEVMADPHLAARNMLVELERTDGVAEHVLVPGNPVKLSKVEETPEDRIPWVGEHTGDVLRAELGLTDDDLAKLRESGAISPD